MEEKVELIGIPEIFLESSLFGKHVKENSPFFYEFLIHIPLVII
jgi:hypothetical protein